MTTAVLSEINPKILMSEIKKVWLEKSRLWLSDFVKITGGISVFSKCSREMEKTKCGRNKLDAGDLVGLYQGYN